MVASQNFSVRSQWPAGKLPLTSRNIAMNAYLVLGDLLITVYSAYLSIYSRAEGQHCTDNDNEIHSDAQETIRGQILHAHGPIFTILR
jgi:hypothetical protein